MSWLSQSITLPDVLPCGHVPGQAPDGAKITIEVTARETVVLMICGTCKHVQTIHEEPTPPERLAQLEQEASAWERVPIFGWGNREKH